MTNCCGSPLNRFMKKKGKNCHLTTQIPAQKLEVQQSVFAALSHRTQIQCDTTFTQSGCDRMLQLKQCLIHQNIFLCMRCHCFYFGVPSEVRFICSTMAYKYFICLYMYAHAFDVGAHTPTSLILAWHRKGHLFMRLSHVTYCTLNWNKRDWGACSSVQALQPHGGSFPDICLSRAQKWATFCICNQSLVCALRKAPRLSEESEENTEDEDEGRPKWKK